MSKNYIVGFPRIGEQRELKKILERFWANKSSFNEVQTVASELKKRHWSYQKMQELILYHQTISHFMIICLIPL